MTPAEELAAIEAWGLPLEGKWMINRAVADACIARYGRVPSNFEVLELFEGEVSGFMGVRIRETRHQLIGIDECAPKPCAPLRYDTLPRGRGAQWKRERAPWGRR